MRKLYSLPVSFCIFGILTASAGLSSAYARPDSVWERTANINPKNPAAEFSEDKKTDSKASDSAVIAEKDKNLPNIVFGNNFTREISKIRTQAEEQGEGTSGNALVGRNRHKKSAKAVCLNAETCSSVTAEEEAGTSLDVSFDDDDNYIAPRVDGGIPKDQSTSAVGLQRNFQNNWNVTGAATFKGRGRGGAAAIGYKW